MAMEFLTFLAVGSLVNTDFLQSVWTKIELLKNIWMFIVECPQWLNYHNHLDENVHILTKQMETLRSLEEDVNAQLVNEELNPRKKRKSEVAVWLKNVQHKKSDVQSIEQSYREMNFLMRAWWGSQVKKNILEIVLLCQHGRFSDSLVLESSRTRGETLLTKRLMDTQKRTLENIQTRVMNDGVSIIGVLGIEGIGKTCIVENVHNGLIDSPNFDHVYWVSVSPEYSIFELQEDIAKVIGFKLDENDERKRAARLHNALNRGKKIVLILDGLLRHFHLDRVGFPTHVNGCKLILTTRSREVCRRMCYREIIEVESLALDEAETLFLENVGLNDRCSPQIEEIAKRIVRECHGLPLFIIDMADQLRGVDDIHEWRNKLNELENRFHD
ncbi:hypothetical protein ACSBR2_028157 [Camellia fascicularis]